MKKLIIFIFLLAALLFTACSPQKRLARLLKHHPELISHDTIHLKDTFISKSVKLDSFFLYDSLKTFDTITLNNGKLTVRIIKIYDTLKVSGECKSDTIIINKTIPVDRIKYETPNFWSEYKIYIFIVSAFLGLIILFLFIKSLFK
jgi:hypothetical protein